MSEEATDNTMPFPPAGGRVAEPRQEHPALTEARLNHEYEQLNTAEIQLRQAMNKAQAEIDLKRARIREQLTALRCEQILRQATAASVYEEIHQANTEQ